MKEKLAKLLEKKAQLWYNVTCRVNDNTHSWWIVKLLPSGRFASWNQEEEKNKKEKYSWQ